MRRLGFELLGVLVLLWPRRRHLNSFAIYSGAEHCCSSVLSNPELEVATEK
jgi:hypothetical protein